MTWLDATLPAADWETAAAAAGGMHLSRLRFIVAAFAAVPLNALWRVVPSEKGARECGAEWRRRSDWGQGVDG